MSSEMRSHRWCMCSQRCIRSRGACVLRGVFSLKMHMFLEVHSQGKCMCSQRCVLIRGAFSLDFCSEIYVRGDVLLWKTSHFKKFKGY